MAEVLVKTKHGSFVVVFEQLCLISTNTSFRMVVRHVSNVVLPCVSAPSEMRAVQPLPTTADLSSESTATTPVPGPAHVGAFGHTGSKSLRGHWSGCWGWVRGRVRRVCLTCQETELLIAESVRPSSIRAGTRVGVAPASAAISSGPARTSRTSALTLTGAWCSSRANTSQSCVAIRPRA